MEVHNLASNEINLRNARDIAKLIGEFMDMEKPLSRIGYINIIKLRVVLDVEQPLPRGCYNDKSRKVMGFMESDWVHFRYERLPKFISSVDAWLKSSVNPSPLRELRMNARVGQMGDLREAKREEWQGQTIMAMRLFQFASNRQIQKSIVIVEKTKGSQNNFKLKSARPMKIKRANKRKQIASPSSSSSTDDMLKDVGLSKPRLGFSREPLVVGEFTQPLRGESGMDPNGKDGGSPGPLGITTFSIVKKRKLKHVARQHKQVHIEEVTEGLRTQARDDQEGDFSDSKKLGRNPVDVEHKGLF
ncbi:conserved hypothetical protein [Ricinus communis]|uniref:Uncharacterized protein n=1 Tax=Ricinus communis TaxID=3988 RepID=B9SMG2_RICCO|nr:conserved hypothetical protein [Ricinus communis]